MKYRVNYQGKTREVEGGETLLAYLADTDISNEVLREAGAWVAEAEAAPENGHGVHFPVGLDIETVKEPKPEPKPEIAPPKEPTEFIICKLTPKNGWCLHTLGGKTEYRANEVLAKCQALEPFTQFKVEEVVSSKCWWNDPFLAN